MTILSIVKFLIAFLICAPADTPLLEATIGHGRTSGPYILLEEDSGLGMINPSSPISAQCSFDNEKVLFTSCREFGFETKTNAILNPKLLASLIETPSFDFLIERARLNIRFAIGRDFLENRFLYFRNSNNTLMILDQPPSGVSSTAFPIRLSEWSMFVNQSNFEGERDFEILFSIQTDLELPKDELENLISSNNQQITSIRVQSLKSDGSELESIENIIPSYSFLGMEIPNVLLSEGATRRAGWGVMQRFDFVLDLGPEPTLQIIGNVNDNDFSKQLLGDLTNDITENGLRVKSVLNSYWRDYLLPHDLVLGLDAKSFRGWSDIEIKKELFRAKVQGGELLVRRDDMVVSVQLRPETRNQ